ncbi:MAG: helix-turn-helix transcriptional regulator [Legionellaceae bacterium]|nr:helix-turn-helix transcriptional regulator [Legionellaceae bacterium]
MEKVNLVDQFAKRLRLALINAEYGSSKSSSGVNISKFAQMTGYSAQICRKYLRGEAIPEPSKLAEIAQKLKVSPGWLLFGDSHTNNANEENKITINKDLLHYIFTHANSLYDEKNNKKDVLPTFLLELTNHVSQIEANSEQSKKIIDLALFSVKHFKQETRNSSSF